MPLPPLPAEELTMLKDELRAFGKAFKSALDDLSWAGAGGADLAGMFQRLWDRRQVGRSLQQHPMHAGKLMRKWAEGKLRPQQADAFINNPVMKPSKDDAHYETRKKILLSFVVIAMFAEVSESYFAVGPRVFMSAKAGPALIKQHLEGEKDKPRGHIGGTSPELCGGVGDENAVDGNPVGGGETIGFGDASIFDDEDCIDTEFRLPLAATPTAALSQESLPAPPLSQSARYMLSDESASRQDTRFSQSPVPTVKAPRCTWPVVGLRTEDPLPSKRALFTTIAPWLRFSMVCIDLAPDTSFSDTRPTRCLADPGTDEIQEGLGGDAEHKVYPFERLMNDSIVTTFALIIPRTLEALYNELGISTASSSMLRNALQLRGRLAPDANAWPGRATRSSGTGDARIGSLSPTFQLAEPPRKKRKVAAPAAPAPMARPRLSLETVGLKYEKATRARGSQGTGSQLQRLGSQLGSQSSAGTR